MKKILSMILIVCFICSAVNPVFAATDTERLEELILSVKERIGSTDEYSEFTSRTSQSEDGSVSYSLQWTAPDKDYKSIYVTVTENGVITRYSNEYAIKGDDRPKISEISRKTALENAKKLVQKLNPDIFDRLLITDAYSSASLWENTFSFEITRTHNGITVPENSGIVTLDEKAEKITYFRIEYTENAEFDDSSSIISKDDAKNAFAEKLGLKMEYAAKYDEKTITAYPVYKFKNSDKKISATDGGVITPNKSFYRGDGVLNGAMKEELSQDFGASGLTQAEIENLELVSGLISKEEGIAEIYANKYIAIDKSFELTDFNTYKKYGTENKYNGSFEFRNKENGKYAYVKLDLNTGDVLSFYIPSSESEGNKMTELQGTDYANEALLALAGEKISEYVNNDELNEVKAYDGGSTYQRVRLTRFVNGIPFNNDFANITVDLKSGIITNFNIEYTDIEFPSVDKVISHKEACEKLFEQIPYKLLYTRHIQDGKTNFKLIYDFEETYISMDAYTGELDGLNSSDEKFTGYTDISGHYAEEIINTLAQYGVRTQGDKFTPDEEITYGDYSKLLGCIARRYGAVYLKTEIANEELGWMYGNGILSEDESIDTMMNVNRLDAAVLLVKTIGAEEFAELDGIYNCPFKDITEKIGYVSILYGMGIFKGDGNGNFTPYKNITYAEAAVMLYNYLTRS